MGESQSNRRIAKNTLALYFRMIVQLLVGLYTSRVILQVLGVNDFGIYSVVGSVTGMLSFVNGAMSNATMRFITFEMGRDNEKRLNAVFCTSVNIHLIIAGFTLLFLDTVGVWFLYNKMVIAPERLDAAFWVLQFSILTCITGIINVPYNACIIAHEKMGTFALFSLFQTVVILLLALLLPYYAGDRLIMYAVILMSVQLILQFMYWFYCKSHFAEATYHKCWDKALMKEMSKFAGWTMNGNVAWLAYTQGLNVLLNLFFGTVVNAARGVAFTVQSKLYGFCDNFQSAVRPQITKSYSAHNFERMHTLVLNSSRFSFFLLLILSLPVFFEIEEILRLWLGTVPDHTANFVRIILLCSAVDVLRNPMNAAAHATGNIKKYQLWEANTLLLILPLAYFTLKLGLSAEYAFLSQLFIFVIVQVERVFIVCPQIHMAKIDYLRLLIFPIAKVTLASVVLPLAILFVWPIESGNSIQLVCFLIITVASAATAVLSLGLTVAERMKAKSVVRRKLHL